MVIKSQSGSSSSSQQSEISSGPRGLVPVRPVPLSITDRKVEIKVLPLPRGKGG